MIATPEAPTLDRLRAQRDQLQAALSEAEAADQAAQAEFAEGQRLLAAWRSETGPLTAGRSTARSAADHQAAQAAYDAHVADWGRLREELHPRQVAKNQTALRVSDLRMALRQVAAQLDPLERYAAAEARTPAEQAELLHAAEQAAQAASEAVAAAEAAVHARQDALHEARVALESARQAQRVADGALRLRQEEAAHRETSAITVTSGTMLERIRARLGG